MSNETMGKNPLNDSDSYEFKKETWDVLFRGKNWTREDYVAELKKLNDRRKYIQGRINDIDLQEATKRRKQTGNG